MKLQIVRLVAKVMGHRNFQIANGKIYLWNAPMFFFALDTLPSLQHNHPDKKKMAEILYYLGRLQSINGTDILIERFGLKEKDLKSFLKMFADQAIMVGQGNVPSIEIIDKDLPHIKYRSPNFHFPREYKKQYGIQKEATCHYLRGLAVGGTELLVGKGKELVAIEPKCVSKGDDECILEVKPKEAWKGDPNFKKQYVPFPPYYKKFHQIETTKSLLSRNK